MVGSGARVLGPFKVGNNVKIAANAVVLEAIPDNCTAVGVPARIARFNGKPTADLDQVHSPYPVAQELCKMSVRLNRLEKELGVKVPEADKTDVCFNDKNNKE